MPKDGKYGQKQKAAECEKQLDATKYMIDFKGCREMTLHLLATKGAGNRN